MTSKTTPSPRLLSSPAQRAGRIQSRTRHGAAGGRVGQPCFLLAVGRVVERCARAIGLHNGIQAMRFKGSTTSDVLAEWEEIFASALAKGPTVIRIVGEMSAVRSMFVSVTEM